MWKFIVRSQNEIQPVFPNSACVVLQNHKHVVLQEAVI